MKSTIKIEDYIIPYEINYNNRLKYMRLHVSADGIKLSTRRGVNRAAIDGFINEKSKWILEHYIKLIELNETSIKKSWLNEETLLFMGKNYNVIIRESFETKCKLKFHNNEFEISVTRSIRENEKSEIIEELIKQWYKKEAKKIINEKLLFYSKKMSVTYNQFRIKEQKTRWGSCSKRNNLNFNWKIIMAPEKVMDYVIIHELCHLVHFNHSKDFWNLLAFYMPDYKVQAEWLKNNGISLHI